MAIDSADKRRSVPKGVPGMPGMARGPIPDGTIDQGDRLEIAGFYRGITPVLPSAVTIRRNGLLMRVYG